MSCRDVSAGSETVSNDSRMLTALALVEQLRYCWIVDAADDGAARHDILREDAKRFDDVIERPVVLEMIGLDIRDDGNLGPELVESAVVLVSLDHDHLSRPDPGVGCDVAKHAADDDRGIEAGIFEN